MKVSVIIPVFNIERYLTYNLESMIGQEGEEIEFIYINDGSTDGSLQILNRYQSKDGRIKVITQENRGLSAARNRGLQEATGEMVVFVDGDDYIANDSLQMLQEMMQNDNLDILLADEISVCDGKQEIITENKEITCGDVCTGMDLLLANQAIFVGCLYVYRRAFLEKYNLRFWEGVLHEDMDFLPRALYYAKRVMKTNYKFYYHVMREGSITSTRNIKRSKDLLHIADAMERFGCTNKMTTIENAYFENYSRFLSVQGIHVGILNGYQIKDLIGNAEERRKVAESLKCGTKKQKIISFVLKYRCDALYAAIYRACRK